MEYNFKLGDKVFCNKRNLNGSIVDYKNNLFTIQYENGAYGRYNNQVLLNRFVLYKEAEKFKNVIYVDFVNKKIAG